MMYPDTEVQPGGHDTVSEMLTLPSTCFYSQNSRCPTYDNKHKKTIEKEDNEELFYVMEIFCDGTITTTRPVTTSRE